MQHVVDDGGLGVQAAVDELLVVLLCLLLCRANCEGVAQVFDVLLRAQLRDARAQHHLEEGDEHVRVPSEDVERDAARLDELVEYVRVLASQHVGVLRGEDEGRTLPLDAVLLLVVAQEVAEVDVEEMAVSGDHDVVIVSVSNAEHKRGHAVACARQQEGLLSLLPLLGRGVVLLEPLGEGVLPEDGLGAAGSLVDVGGGVGVLDDLDHADFVAGGDAAVGLEEEIEALVLPEFVEDADYLESEHVLSEVVAHLEDDEDWLSDALGVLPNQPQGQLLGVHIFTLLHHQFLDNHPLVERELELRIELELGQGLHQHLLPLRAVGRLLHLHRHAHQRLGRLVLLEELRAVRAGAAQVALQEEGVALGHVL
mmetsp:Transcript_419/g.1447  ORF Transcript_419/g.1447 Transcript_419/m.1447 type:complete len:368 (+) Transcript_419:196-1299(+)